MTTITYNDNSTVTLKFENDKKKLEYKDADNIAYEGELDLEDFEDANIKTQDELINFLKNNKPEIKKTDDIQEIKIAFGGITSLILKQKNTADKENETNTNHDDKPGNNDTNTDAKPGNNDTNPYIKPGNNDTNSDVKPGDNDTNGNIIGVAPLPEINYLEEIAKLKKEYEEKMKKAKIENEELKKKNKELKEDIEEEKRKNDEIVRIYLNNRQKYEEAVQRNNVIREFEKKI